MSLDDFAFFKSALCRNPSDESVGVFNKGWKGTMAETTFVRTRKDRNYTMLDNTFLRDERLSAGAKGVFAYLLFLPEDWVIYQSELANHFSNGRDSIRNIISELEKFGYIIIKSLKHLPSRIIRNGLTVTGNPQRIIRKRKFQHYQ